MICGHPCLAFSVKCSHCVTSVPCIFGQMLALPYIRALHSRQNALTYVPCILGKMLALPYIRAVHSQQNARITLHPCLEFSANARITWVSVPCISGKILALPYIRALHSRQNALTSVPCILGKMPLHMCLTFSIKCSHYVGICAVNSQQNALTYVP